MDRKIIAYPSSASKKETVIYGLEDPDTGIVRYIGKTTLGLKARLQTHVSASRNKSRKFRSANWIRSLIENGKTPNIFEIETIPPYGDWQEAEIHWIATFRAFGVALTNCTTGGEGVIGVKRTEEWIRKISESQKGKFVSEATRSLISKAGKGRKIPPDAAARSAATRTGMKRSPCSEEQKRRMSDLYKGKPRGPLSEETKRKISDARKGKKLSDEHVEKLRQAALISQKRIADKRSEDMKLKWEDPGYRTMILDARRSAR